MAEAKRKEEEARLLAEAKRKEEEARVLAEAERKRQRIASVQKALQELGFYKGSIDGALGRGTLAALSSWLSQQGRPKKTELDDAIISELTSAAEAKRLAELERRRTEEEERRLAEAKRKAEEARLAALEAERQRQMIVSAQQSLNTLGLYKGEADGKFGRKSLAALGAWLERNGHAKTTLLDETIVAQLGKAAEAQVARLAAEAEANAMDVSASPVFYGKCEVLKEWGKSSAKVNFWVLLSCWLCMTIWVLLERNSAMTCRQAPQGGVGQGASVTMVMQLASLKSAPAACAAAKAFRSAQTVRP